MFHNRLTYQQLSDFFHLTTFIGLVNLLCKVLQIYYVPDATRLSIIIDNISNATFFTTTIIIVGLALKFFLKDYKSFTKKHKILALSIMACIVTFIVWIVITNKILKFYLFAIKDMHDKKAVYLFAFIICMLIFDSYYAYKDHSKIGEAALIKSIFKSFRLLLYKYLVIGLSYAGLLHMTELHRFAETSVPIIQYTTLWFASVLGLLLVSIWTIYFLYYVVKNILYHQDK